MLLNSGFCGIPLASLISAIWAWPTEMNQFERRNFNTISSIYNLTIYPNQLPILKFGDTSAPRGLFNPAVLGRVDPIGNFTGFDDSVEYFLALSPLPQANIASQAITSIKLTEFSSACSSVAASVVYLFTSVVNPESPENGQALAPLKQVAFWKFDNEGLVLKYDAWIPNLNAWLEASTGISISNPQLQAGTIEELCIQTQQRCTGNNTQWDSTTHCIASLTAKPYGNYDEAWGDNIVCRTIHIVLAQVRPNVHCSHVGPTGGGKCVNYAYPLEYFSDQTFYKNSLGNTFKCH